jgi:hypothetical protein
MRFILRSDSEEIWETKWKELMDKVGRASINKSKKQKKTKSKKPKKTKKKRRKRRKKSKMR